MLNKNVCVKVWHLAVAVLFLALVFIFVPKPGGGRNKYESQLVAKLDSMTLANQRLDSIKNAQGKIIQTQQAIVVNTQSDIKALTDSIFNLKNKQAKQIKQIIAYYSQKTSTVIDSIPVPFLDSTQYRKFKDSLDFYRFAKDSLITVPKQVEIDSLGAFHLDATITKKALLINNITIIDSQYLRIVENKGGFFKKVNGKLKFHVPKTVQFQSFHTNPLIHVTGQNSILYTPNSKPKVLEKVLIFGAGVYLGTLF